MYINFGGGGLLGFGDIASFRFDQISLSYHELNFPFFPFFPFVHGSEKFYYLEWAQNFYAFRG